MKSGVSDTALSDMQYGNFVEILNDKESSGGDKISGLCGAEDTVHNIDQAEIEEAMSQVKLDY